MTRYIILNSLTLWDDCEIKKFLNQVFLYGSDINTGGHHLLRRNPYMYIILVLSFFLEHFCNEDSNLRGGRLSPCVPLAYEKEGEKVDTSG